MSKKEGCRAYRGALHQILAKLKRRRAQNDPEVNLLGDDALQKRAGDTLHELVRKAQAGAPWEGILTELRAAGVDRDTATAIAERTKK